MRTLLSSLMTMFLLLTCTSLALGEAAKKSDGGSHPFEFTIQDVFTITGRGVVVTGKVTKGQVQNGDQLTFLSANAKKSVKVTGIESFRKVIDVAKAGDSVGILLDGLTKEEVSKGDTLVSSE